MERLIVFVVCSLLCIISVKPWPGKNSAEGVEGGGGTLKCLYIRRLGPFGGQKFEFRCILGFSDKLIIFWGTMIFLVIFFECVCVGGEITKLDYVCGYFSVFFR